MKKYSLQSNFVRVILSFVFVLLTACGGGDQCGDAPLNAYTPEQISKLTPSQAKGLRDIEIISMGENFKLLSDESLSHLSDRVAQLDLMCPRHVPNIFAISASQIASLTPHQVRFIGSFSDGIAKLSGLSLDVFEKLMSDPIQAANLTPKEFKKLPSQHFKLIGTNIKYLSDSTLSAYRDTYIPSMINLIAPIQSITISQINALSPSQIKLLGTEEDGLSKYTSLSDASYEAMMSNPENVIRITPKEFANFDNKNISLIGENIKYVSDNVLAGIFYKYISTPRTTKSQIGALTGVQVASLSSHQMQLIIERDDGNGLSHISKESFGSLLPGHLSRLEKSNILGIKSEQLAQLTVESAQSIPLETRMSFTKSQKSLLSYPLSELFK